MKLVYLSGPYTPYIEGNNSYCAREANINFSRKAAVWCAENGIGYFSPHLNSAHFDVIVPQVTYEFWMELDFRVLRNCDGLILLHNWQHSRGAKRERDYALANDIPVFEFIGDKERILEWSKET